jgi:LEA14-like dessication related protein
MRAFGLILFLLTGWLMMSACSSLNGIVKDPVVHVTEFKLANVSSEGVSIDLGLNVQNPNSVPLKLDAVNYALNVAGEKVTEGTFDKGVNIPAGGEGTVYIPLKFQFTSVGNLLSGLMDRSLTKDYELTGSAKLGFISVPFVQKGTINLNK